MRLLSDDGSSTSHMVGRENDLEELGISEPDASRLRALSFAKSFSQMISDQSQELAFERALQGHVNVFLKPEDVEIDRPFDEHHLGWISNGRVNGKRRVFVEWIRYDLHWEGEVQKEMISRVANIASFLHEKTSQSHSLRILQSCGYFHALKQRAFGLVYELPISDQDSTPRSLNAIITETRKSGFARISLEDRLMLARTLTSTLLEIHKGTLVHKSISSHNILFFSPQLHSLQNPYLVGFNHSRPSEPKAFTTGPPPALNARRYYHPDYTADRSRGGERFRLEFDYYSLGLVLMEIGLWDTVSNFKTKSTPELLQLLLKQYVPILGHTVGTAYRNAVKVCFAR